MCNGRIMLLLSHVCSYSPVAHALAAASSSPPCPSVSFPPRWAVTAVLLLKAQRIPHPDLDWSPGSLAAQRQALQGEGGPQQCPLCSGVRGEQTSGKQVLLLVPLPAQRCSTPPERCAMRGAGSCFLPVPSGLFRRAVCAAVSFHTDGFSANPCSDLKK